MKKEGLSLKNFKVRWGTGSAYFKLALMGLAGVFLIVLGSYISRNEKTGPATIQYGAPGILEYEDFIAGEVTKAVSAVKGAGEVLVSISLESGPESVYASNNTYSRNTQTELTASGDERMTSSENRTVQPVTGRFGGSDETPILEKTNMPKVAGCLVVAEGAVSSAVKLEIYHAVQALLGIPIYKIQVVAMERGR
jgi:stage III sporulation protein AG